jgi:glutaminyl-tRNA synthetase
LNIVTPSQPERFDFIREIVAADLRDGRHSHIVTRFPPEPNGYLHIGHAKSICLNFGIAREFDGHCNLRFDDTNPVKEEQEYIDAIQADVRWLGFDWADRLYHASDYFEQLYEWAVSLIRAGNAYVDDLSGDEIREYRGTLTLPGRNSPWRDRSVDENVDLFSLFRAASRKVSQARGTNMGLPRAGTCPQKPCSVSGPTGQQTISWRLFNCK